MLLTNTFEDEVRLFGAGNIRIHGEKVSDLLLAAQIFNDSEAQVDILLKTKQAMIQHARDNLIDDCHAAQIISIAPTV
jgi:hypothetical protein